MPASAWSPAPGCWTPDTPIPAGATIDVPVGGTKRAADQGHRQCPLLNLTVATPGVGGLLDAWPADGTPPNLSILNFRAGNTRASLVAVRPGGEGTVRILNGSTAPLHLLVDLQGWFAEPVTPLPTIAYTPTSALQGPAGIENGVG